MIVCKNCQGRIWRSMGWRCPRCNPQPGDTPLEVAKPTKPIKLTKEPQAPRERNSPGWTGPIPDMPTLEEITRKHIFAVYMACKENKTIAARVLGVSTKTLYNKLEAYDFFRDERSVH